MCHVHIIKKLPSAQRKKYLPAAQVMPCQDKPKGISLSYSNFVWNLTWTFHQRVLAKLKILLLSKTEVPQERKTFHSATARATQAESCSTWNSFQGAQGTSLRRGCQAGAAVTPSCSTAGSACAVGTACTFHLLLWATGAVTLTALWSLGIHFFPRNLSHYQKYILNVIKFAGQLAV